MSDDDATIAYDEWRDVYMCYICHRGFYDYDMIHDELNDERVCFNCAY